LVLRISHTLFRIVATLVASAIITVAALGARLAVAPIQLTWLAPYLERAIAPADRRIKIEIQDAGVRLGQHRVIELVGAGVRATGPDGEVLIDLPEIQIGISLRALLWHGMLAPASLEAKAPLLILTRNEAGNIGLSGARAETQPAEPRGQIDLNELLAPLISDESSQPLSYLEQADISGGRLVLRDQVTNHTIMARDGTLIVRRLLDGVSADLTFALDQEGAPAKVQTRVARDAVTGRVRFAVDFEQLSPAELAKIEPSLSLDGVDLVLAGRLAGDIDRDQGLSPIAFELQAENGLIERPDWLAGPLPIDSVSIKGRLAANLSAAEVTDARIVAKGATVETTAQIVWADRQISLRAKAAAHNVAARDLKLYWPPAAGPEARDWVLASITDGVVPNAEVTIALKPGDLDRYPFPEGAVRGRFEFQGLSVRYFETMPPLTRVDGSATFTARRMDFALTGGRVGAIRVADGSVAITGMGIKGRDTTQLVIKAAIDSPLDQALALLDHRPLGFASKLGVAPANASGQARTDLTITLPLHHDLDASELNVQASAQLQGAGIRGLPGQLDLSDGDFTLKIDNRGADLTGQGAVNGIPLAIEWHESFAEHAAVKRSYHVAGTFDVQALRRLGLDLPIPATGTSQIDATMTESAKGREAKLAVDLGPLAVDVPALGWQKPKDQAGHLTASILMAAGGPVQVEAFELASTGLDVAGSLEMSVEPVQIERLTLSRFRAGRNEGALDLHHQAEQGYQIAVRAQTIDLAPVLEMRLPAVDATDGGAPTPLNLSLVADHILFGDLGLSDVDLDLVRDAQGWRNGAMHGRLPKGGKVELTLKPADDQRQLKVTSDDAGDLLQALDQTTHIEGGKLELNATIRRQVPALDVDGKLRVKDFTLLDAPVLARVLTVASLTGIGNLLGGQGIHFDRLDLPFTLRQRLLTIEKGRLSGSQLGLTMRGRVDLASERLDLNGTIVPLYGLNWVIGKLPLVGPFLTGREGEGAFAVTYSVTGPPSNPEVSVNPLAVLAPGFLRDLFSGLVDSPPETVPAISPD
jgi:AsmA-like C-terminal region/Protein of unknown function